jgi:dynein heavy chain 1, cytosolic
VLAVNFDDQLTTLFKEVRNLVWMDVTVPTPVTAVANISKAVYPFAASLLETVRIYQATNTTVNAHPTVALLVAGQHKRIQGLFTAGTLDSESSRRRSYADAALREC